MNAQAQLSDSPVSRADTAMSGHETPGTTGHHAHEHGGRIGPNAITRVAESLAAFESTATLKRIFEAAGITRHLDTPPSGMVDEREVTALHRALRAELGPGRARSVSWAAGRLTADYLLANRIPQPAQRVLRIMPPAIASRMLLAAIGKHSWTFAGSGNFSAHSGHPVIVEIAGCPICRDATASMPLCDFYAATFERLFAELVSANARVVETACSANGAIACTFEIRWR